MNKNIYYLIGVIALVIFGLFLIPGFKFASPQVVRPTPTSFISIMPSQDYQDQGIIYKGLYTYGLGIKLNCTTLDGKEKADCEQRNKDNYLNPAKAQPIPTNLIIKDQQGKKEKEIYFDGSKDFMISLTTGYHNICAQYQGADHCFAVYIKADIYSDFAIPIMRQ